MKPAKQYDTATAFRTALEARLNNYAAQNNIDVQRLRREVAFDRLLSRLFHAPDASWLLKGGYAMELRMGVARTTLDIDLTFNSEENADEYSILEMLQDASSTDLEDYFVFLIGEATTDLDSAPYGGFRYPVEARMDGRTFVRFHLDVGIGDVALAPFESLHGKDWLSFAGIPVSNFTAISREQQFAEKYHAYTLPRENRPNSRVKDLIDLILLIETEGLNSQATLDAIKITFERRKTHDLPAITPDSPADWKERFENMAKDCELNLNLEQAVELLRSFMKQLGA